VGTIWGGQSGGVALPFTQFSLGELIVLVLTVGLDAALLCSAPAAPLFLTEVCLAVRRSPLLHQTPTPLTPHTSTSTSHLPRTPTQSWPSTSLALPRFPSYPILS
jgi:hypothetical protein